MKTAFLKNFFLSLLFLAFLLPSLGQTKVACVGNSITFGSGIEGRDSLAYPPQLQKILGDDWLVKNFGRSAATMLKKGNLPYWDQQEFADARAFLPDIVIIMLGTNDSKPVNWESYQDEYPGDYKEMIRVFRSLESQPTIFICRPIPVVATEWGIDKKIVEEIIPPILQSISESENVGLIDLFTPLKDRYDLIPDHIHPNAEGSAVLAATIAKVLLQDKN